ncbi:hypothetical protein JQ559_18070 [Bradyrhizobium viridifuturi]|jgi:hypothetical protein|uniref:hypothetical protein n=1 Tax=Bradyrhizobium TaxID=374 RepID=UPI0003967CA2|nr:MULTISPECIES: hypothetical protein [Bradyrhizobium]ERF84966.1 MAG: hypothetical protein C207_01786 [Bradyrhizobium sp. DFCI-1]OYU60105.1 MAG: hypothetical protein CFE30_22320 [Bradyrhizobium sp. PARBB1]PSO26184.1 hypothetical protein C7G43_13130 [Bradyrhizobium sp. MOS004]QRI71836.1 hypothetical protein JQ507_10325 [Bradyrhizobium sp. PSBB068]MBR1024274.1 hypothetical protein [Bradyrhizobium viridifuturi]
MVSSVFILATVFVAGFFSGFAARSWRSHKRRAQYQIHAPYVAPSAARSPRRDQPLSAFGHMRRAF